MKTLLVTGGCGFIGSNFIHYWHNKYPENRIINLDKLTYAGHQESLSGIEGSNYKFVCGDISDKELVDSLTKNIDIIVHFAAETHVDRSIKDASYFLKTNILGTHILLESCLKNKVKRFHHVSTDEVFGSLELNSKNKFSENTKYDPRSPYSASKASSDHLVMSYHTTFGLPVTITNCSNNYGPYQDPEKFLPRMITNLIDNKKIPIYGDGKNVRDWLHVEDHISAIDLVLNSEKVGETYVIGGLTKDISNLEVAKKVIQIYGGGEIEFVKDRLGHDKKYAVDWNKIKKEFGWKPQYSFDSGLEETIKWYKENEKWWRPLKKQAEDFYSNAKN